MENESLNNRPIAELVSFPNSDFVKINHGAGWSPTKLGGCSGVIVYFPPGKVMYLHSPKTMVSKIEHFPWASHLQFRWCLMSLSPRYFTTGRDHYWVEERKTSFQSGWQSEFDDSSWTELSGYLKGRFKDVGRKKLFCLQRIVVQYLSESSTYNNGNVGVGVRDFTIENRMDPPVCRVTVKARCKNWTANSCVCVCVCVFDPSPKNNSCRGNNHFCFWGLCKKLRVEQSFTTRKVPNMRNLFRSEISFWYSTAKA